MFVTLTDMLRICGISGVIGMFIGAIIVAVAIEVFGGKK